MSKQERHTIIRISLRSMLGITFGIALVMAVAGPYIKALDPDRQRRLLVTIAALAGGMAIGTFFVIRRRHAIGQQCGPLLLSLALGQERNKKWLRWLWLLVIMPFIILHFSNVASSYNPPPSLWNAASQLLLPACYSMFMTQMGLALWAEGYTNAIEFCKNGILHTNKFYAWSSPALRNIYWGQSGHKLVININRAPISVPVPPEQREGIEAIVENYCKAQSPTTDQN